MALIKIEPYIIDSTGNFTFDAVDVTGNLSSLNANLGNLVQANYFTGNFYGTANLAIYATTANSVAGGNVSGQVANALVAGTVYTAAQPNITSIGTLTGLTSNGVVNFSNTSNTTLGAVGNLHISGGTNAYVLSTDGAGNLSWVAQSGGGGGASISNGTSNVNIASSGGNVTVGVAGNANILTVTGTGVNVAGTLNVTGNATVGNLITSGSGGNLTSINVVSANTFLASTSVTSPQLISNIATGTAPFVVTSTTQVANLHVATAGTVTTATQSNITSLGTLTSLTVGPNSSVILSGTSGFVKANSIQGTDGTAALYMYYGSVSGAAGVRTDFTIGAGGSGNLIANAGNAIFGDVSTVTITGGSSGQYLQTNGSGVLTWATASGGGGASISNGTSNVNIASSGGNVTVGVAGNANILTVTGTGSNIAGTLNVTGNATVGNLITSGSGGNLTSINVVSANTFLASASVTAPQLISNIATGTAPFIVTSTTQVANLNVATAGTVTTNAQPNITSTGSLTGLTVSNATGVVDFTTTANVSLGAVANLKITGGSANFFLQTNGSGTLTWAQALSTITDNTSAATTYYPVYATSSSGDLTTAGITTTKLQFVPSTGTLTVTDLNTLSDMTLKENPESITDPMLILSQLFGMGFNWVDSKKKSYGLMAQMVEKVLPELVSTNAQGKKAINYIPIIAFLIEAVKKQQEDIEALKKR